MARKRTEGETAQSDVAIEAPEEETAAAPEVKIPRGAVRLICPMCGNEGTYRPGRRSCPRCNVVLMTEGELKAWKERQAQKKK